MLACLKKEDLLGSTGQVPLEALSTVLGVSSQGNIVSATPLLVPDLFSLEISDFENTPEDKPSRSSIRLS